MQVSVENTSALERRMTIAVPAERVENEVNKRLQQTAKRAKVAGFRPGKVPMSVIRQRFEADARQEAFGDLVQASFYEAIVEQKLNPLALRPSSLSPSRRARTWNSLPSSKCSRSSPLPASSRSTSSA